MQHNRHRRAYRAADAGVIVVMVLIIAGILVVAATAFLVLAGTESRALGYRTAERQALFACYSGLEHGKAVIEATVAAEWSGSNPSGILVTPNGLWSSNPDGSRNAFGAAGAWPSGGWVHFFETAGAGAAVQPAEEDKVEWLYHYGGDDYGNGPAAFFAGRPTHNITAGGLTVGEYAVYICELDGRVHTNPGYFTLGAGATAIKLVEDLTDGLGLTNQQQNDLEGGGFGEYAAFGELKTECALGWDQLLAVIPFFTPYPVGNLAKHYVNLNTARTNTLKALLAQVPSLKTEAATLDALVQEIATKRPFGSRKALEKVIYDFFKPRFDAAPNVGEKKKVERQFNDTLNSFNGQGNPDATSDYLAAGSWVYEYDLENLALTGGDNSLAQDVTWACELKFNSRFFRIVVLGRGWRIGEGRSRTVRRWLEAIYDTAGGKIIWQRLHLTPDLNIITN